MIMPLSQPPVRPCCGQRHWHVVCPDGKVMCCLCFRRFGPDQLHVDEHGDRWDVCAGCAEQERTNTQNRRTP